ncbi:zinc finger protein 660-like [Anopheles moucheti]|uniref:zinc finger protein 660-like n=1 Tax=Anopheles moucheti TaxID=186751 RepID=UPI0022F0DC4F|nr:zinc finger protein 660-like [Anopheles moucheti]
MELTCLCCLAEATLTYKMSTRCEFRTDECNDTNPSNSMVQLGELYALLIQLPSKKLLSDVQLLYDDICSRCVDMLKDFYRFRMRAMKAYEELLTKANIAKIINSLEQSSASNEETEQSKDYIGNTGENTNIQRLQSSGNTQAGYFVCTTCQKQFKNRKLLSRHQEIHSTTKNYKCQYCEMQFAAKASCYNHELRIHIKDSQRNGKQTLVSNKKSSNAAKKRRLPETSNENPEHQQIKKPRFPCDLCLKSFTRKSSLNDHKLVLHAGVRQHVCHICNRTFGKENSLKTHLVLHVGKKYRCKLCSKSFAKGSFLRKHLEEHELPESKRRYTCGVCSKKFTTMSHLNDHELIHSNEKPHKCNHCERSFRQKQQLKVHTYQHFGKPFQCTYCDMAYTSPSRLQAHVNKHHPRREQTCANKSGFGTVGETSTVLQPDFGDKAVNEEILNEICYQINSNPIMLENIDAGGVNLICNEPIVFLNE